MPEISVIVPVYNSEKYLRRCIYSILNQTFNDFELILIDDGSTDSSGKICDEFLMVDNRVRVFHQKNQGQALARNFGVNNSIGKWIAFIDSDDVVNPKMLEVLYDACISSNVLLSMCGAIESNKLSTEFFEINTIGDYQEILITDKAMHDICINGKHRYWIVWGKLIEKNLVKKLLFTDERIYEDNALVPKWFYSAKKIVNVDSNLYFYQVNDTGTTKDSFSMKQLDYLWALEEQIKFYEFTKYKKMLSAVSSHYLQITPLYYKKVLNKYGKCTELKNIKKKSFTLIIKQWTRIKLNKTEVYEVLNMYFPNLMSIYSQLKTLEFERGKK